MAKLLAKIKAQLVIAAINDDRLLAESVQRFGFEPDIKSMQAKTGHLAFEKCF
jgi:hypothetical protein